MKKSPQSRLCMEDRTSRLRRRVFSFLRTVPSGTVVTYGQIASYLGDPHLARAVGNALHCNTDPQTYPCHRVVHADGRLSEAYAFGGMEAQADRLRREGVEVTDGRVDLSKYGYRRRLW